MELGVKKHEDRRHCTGRPCILEFELEIVKEEMRRGVRRLKERKVTVLCGIESEVLKAGEVAVQG